MLGFSNHPVAEERASFQNTEISSNHSSLLAPVSFACSRKTDHFALGHLLKHLCPTLHTYVVIDLA